MKETNSLATQDSQLNFLYHTLPGRLLLKVLIRPGISRFVGRIMNHPISALKIDSFVKKNGIDLSQFEKKRYHSYNDFFTRKIRPDQRPIDQVATHLIAPCDGKCSIYPLSRDSHFSIKHSSYSIVDLTNDSEMADEYEGGTCIILRLTVDDYHRYIYLDDGTKDANVAIPGVLHTVNPIALDVANIYQRNAREYTILHTKNFGDVIQVEVGALMVGRICNHHEEYSMTRGEEKGYFEFGGSTIVLMLKKDAFTARADIVNATKSGLETTIRMGECLGTKSC